jgi:hypothetical protein
MQVAVESRNCSLPEIVPLVRAVQADIQNVLRIFETESSRCRLRMILTRFIARVLNNNRKFFKSGHIDMVTSHTKLEGEMHCRLSDN